MATNAVRVRTLLGETVKRLYREILAIRGAKIVTVDVGISQSFDIDARGKVGYARSHKWSLLLLMKAAVAGAGGILVRQFTPIRIDIDTPKGRMPIPAKRVYGIVAGGGDYRWLSAAEVREACETDASTGARLPREPAVSYSAWPRRSDHASNGSKDS